MSGCSTATLQRAAVPVSAGTDCMLYWREAVKPVAAAHLLLRTENADLSFLLISTLPPPPTHPHMQTCHRSYLPALSVVVNVFLLGQLKRAAYERFGLWTIAVTGVFHESVALHSHYCHMLAWTHTIAETLLRQAQTVFSTQQAHAHIPTQPHTHPHPYC
jgi:C-terminus of AA_permease